MSHSPVGRHLSVGLRCALAAALVALCGAPARAQNGIESMGNGGKHSIRGRIFFPSGRRVDTGLKVRLESTGFGDLTVISDSNGSFYFQSLRPGTYTVVVEGGDEFESVREQVTIDSDSSMMRGGGGVPSVPRPYTVQIYLQPRAARASDARPGVLNAALAGVPKPAVELYNKALDAERNKENEKAAALLGEAVAQYPQFGLARSELGMLYLKAGQLDRAVEEFKAAEKALPDDPQVQFNYGLALLERKSHAEAEKHFRRAAKRMGQSAQLHTYLGIALIGQAQAEADAAAKQSKLAEAERELQQSIKLGGDPIGRAHYYLGGIYWSKHEYKKAADELEIYVKQSPKAPDAEQTRATIKQLRGRS